MRREVWERPRREEREEVAISRFEAVAPAQKPNPGEVEATRDRRVPAALRRRFD